MQVTKLLRSPAAHTTTQTRLKRLYTAGYLDRDRIPWRLDTDTTSSRLSTGTTPLCYVITTRGLTLLRSHGVAVPERATPWVVHEFSYLFLAHLMATNEALIAGELLARQEAHVRLLRALPELYFARQPIFVRDAGGARRTVRLDGYLEFAVMAEHGYRAPVCLELDRGTENQSAFRRKIRRLLAAGRGPLQAALNCQTPVIAFIATSGANRLRAMVEWTEAELSELGASGEDVDLFRFAAFRLDWDVPEAERPTPQDIFLAPRWYAPFERQPEPLLEGVGTPNGP
jgi:hypothetical protein